MRITAAWLTGVVAIAGAASLLAQPPSPAASFQTDLEPETFPDLSRVNVFDVVVRGMAYAEGSDEARDEQYGDLRNGGVFDTFRFSNDTSSRLFDVADHAGSRDQRYAASLNLFGRLKASFEWNQIPLFVSESTVSQHTDTLPGELRIDDAVQRGIQNAQATLPEVAPLATQFDTRRPRSIADVRLSYAASEHLDVNVNVRNTMKTGSQPGAGTFGFSDAVELPVPVDTRTTDLGASLEFANLRGSARVAYDGSFFAPLPGRLSLWPDSTTNTGSVMGTLNLPGRSRATANISIADSSQNAALAPFTINTTLPPIPLGRQTADTSALLTTMNYTFTSRLAENLAFNARYRSYDFDNRTPIFHVAQTASYHTSVSTDAPGGNSPDSLKRKTLDADLSYTPAPHTALRAGYAIEKAAQTFRTFDTTTADTLRLSADLAGTAWLTVGGVYEHARRTGQALDDQVFADVGEQTSPRQFDFSDRAADRFSAVVVVTTAASLSLNGSVTVGNDDRDAGFGVVSGNGRAYSIGVDVLPGTAVSLSASYIYEKYGTLQSSRQANDTFTADLDLIKVWPKIDLRVGYNFSKGHSLYVDGLAPNTTLAPVQQVPLVTYGLQRATIDGRYYLTTHTALGLVYSHDQYRGDDLAQVPETLTSIAQPSLLMIGYTNRSYTANTFVGRVTYAW